MALLESEQAALSRRLRRMVGSRDVAEDLLQETLARAWNSAPRQVDTEGVRAWMHRVASNLAIDELRRAGRHPTQPLEEAGAVMQGGDPADLAAANQALERMSADHRLALLLRFQAGFSYPEISAFLDISEVAARQRVARARRAFARALHHAPLDRSPRIFVLSADEYVQCDLRWLRSAGADARPLPRKDLERNLASADGLVVAGQLADVDPAVYGQAPRRDLFAPDVRDDLFTMRLLRLALQQDIPTVAMCRGHQLLNVIFGGTLYQDIAQDRRAVHPEGHPVSNSAGSLARRMIGRRARVSTSHHQAIDEVGPGLRAVSVSDDGVVEAVEVPRSRFAIGIQFHCHEEPSVSDHRVAEALVEAATRAAA